MNERTKNERFGWQLPHETIEDSAGKTWKSGEAAKWEVAEWWREKEKEENELVGPGRGADSPVVSCLVVLVTGNELTKRAGGTEGANVESSIESSNAFNSEADSSIEMKEKEERTRIVYRSNKHNSKCDECRVEGKKRETKGQIRIEVEKWIGKWWCGLRILMMSSWS